MVQLSCVNAVIEGTQGGGMGKDMGREDGDLGVVVGVRMEVRSPREGVGSVSLSRYVYEGVVVVGKARDELSYSSCDVLRVGVVFKVLVVSVDRDGV